MSKLQKCILEEGLIAHWDGPFDLALNRREPGSFDIRNILVDFFHADKKDVTMSYWSERRGDHRQRLAKPRAAISRSISRLMKRGFLERVEPAGRGRWRLTKEGKSVDLGGRRIIRSEEHTSELQSHLNIVCRLLLE